MLGYTSRAKFYKTGKNKYSSKRPVAVKVVANTTKSKKKKQRDKLQTAIVRGPAPFADRYKCQMKYADNKQYTPTVAVSVNVYAINGGFDPDLTGVGHQPMGWDELSSIYGTYRITGSRLTAKFVNATPDMDAMCFVCPTDDPVAFLLPNFREQVYTQMKISSNEKPCTISMYMSAAKILGRLPAVVQVENSFGANWNANPTQLGYWQIGVIPADNATQVDVSVYIDIVYYITWSGLKVLTQS